MRKPRALRRGDRIAVVAPASPFARAEFDSGIAELRAIGFEPVFDESVFARQSYLAGPPETRAGAWRSAWCDPSIAALVAARGGYGSVQLLPLLDPALVQRTPKIFIGYSDNTSLLVWLTLGCGIVSFHGPMIEGRFARGAAGYDAVSLNRAVCRPEPAGEIGHPALETLRPGEAAGLLIGGTLTQLVSSLGTPYAFDPPSGCVLFLDEVSERPYRIDRMLTQLRLSGVLGRAAAIVFGELPRCDEPGGNPTAKAAVAEVLRDFPGPVLFGLPSGHTSGPTLTLPFGVSARVVAGPRPLLVIEEPAVTPA
ncbi:MAG TPA: LD-carboxypeptidase [Vicinamibacterales bacterium]|nr:LD-carboxypeptidase [Vicinamibacterales bacterium]